MCKEDRHGSASESLHNLRQPMPPGRKVKLILRNQWRKMSTHSDCCGNYGEPGC